MVVEHCGKEVVCCADCMEISGEMEIDVLHGNDLSISAAGGTAFYAENGTQ